MHGFQINTYLLHQIPAPDEMNPYIHSKTYDMAADLVKEFDALEIKEQGFAADYYPIANHYVR